MVPPGLMVVVVTVLVPEVMVVVTMVLVAEVVVVGFRFTGCDATDVVVVVEGS